MCSRTQLKSLGKNANYLKKWLLTTRLVRLKIRKIRLKSRLNGSLFWHLTLTLGLWIPGSREERVLRCAIVHRQMTNERVPALSRIALRFIRATSRRSGRKTAICLARAGMTRGFLFSKQRPGIAAGVSWPVASRHIKSECCVDRGRDRLCNHLASGGADQRSCSERAIGAVRIGKGA
jgi:hypothetical protein